jgi:hypothetical protein
VEERTVADADRWHALHEAGIAVASGLELGELLQRVVV